MPYIQGLTASTVIANTPCTKISELSEKGKALAETFSKYASTISSEYHAFLLDVASALIDERLPNSLPAKPPKVLSGIIITSNPNSHNYPTNELVLFSHADICIRKDGSFGNAFPMNSKPAAWRYATETEILNAFGEKVTETEKDPDKSSESTLNLRT